MGDERRGIHGPVRDLIDKGLHVALLGPAHVGRWIVVTSLLIDRVVTTRPVGAGDDEFRLLEEERASRKVETHSPDGNDASLSANRLRRELDRLVGRRRCRDQHGIGAESTGRREHVGRPERRAGRLGTELARQLALGRIEVRTKHTAAAGFEQRDDELADEP